MGRIRPFGLEVHHLGCKNGNLGGIFHNFRHFPDKKAVKRVKIESKSSKIWLIVG